MKAGADVNLQRINGFPPISIASYRGHTETVGTDSFVSLGLLVMYLIEVYW